MEDLGEGVRFQEGAFRTEYQVIPIKDIYDSGSVSAVTPREPQPPGITRREFLKGSAVAGLALFGLGSRRAVAGSKEPQAEFPDIPQDSTLLDLEREELETRIGDLEKLTEFPILASTWVQLCRSRGEDDERLRVDILTTGSNNKTREQVENELGKAILADEGTVIRVDVSRFGENNLLVASGEEQSICLIPPEEIINILRDAGVFSTLEDTSERPMSLEDLEKLNIPATKKLVGMVGEHPFLKAYLEAELANPRGIFYRTRTNKGEWEYVRQALTEPGAAEKPEGEVISFQIFAGESPHVDNEGNIISTMTAIVGRMRPKTVYNGIVATNRMAEQTVEVKRAPDGVEFYNASPINLPNRPEGEEAFVVEVDNITDGEITDPAGVNFQKGTSTWLFTRREDSGEIIEEWIRLDSQDKKAATALRPAKAYVVESGEGDKPVVLLESDLGVKAVFIDSTQSGIDTESVLLGKIEDFVLPVGEIKGEYITTSEQGKPKKQLIIYRAFGKQEGARFDDRTFNLQRAQIDFSQEGKTAKVKKLQSILKRPLPAAEPIGIKISKTDGQIKLAAEVDRYDDDPMLILLQDDGERILAGVVVSTESTIQGKLKGDKLFVLETAGLNSKIDGPYGAARASLYLFNF